MSTSPTQSVSATGFSSYSPLAKLGLWLAGTVTIAAVVQVGAWASGANFDILSESGGGRGVLMGIAVALLLILMGADRRTSAEYGLSITNDWKRRFLNGFLLGAVLYGGFSALAWLFGAYTLNTDGLTAYRCSTALLAACAALPVALTQQVIFSGYLLSTLRDRYSALLSAIVSGLLFAVLATANSASFLVSADSQRLFVGLMLIATLLGLLRLQHGNIVFPTALLTGCIVVRRLIRKTHLLAATGGAEGVEWWAPAGDPRQSPMLWLVILAGSAVCWRALQRQGEPELATQTSAINSGFKRVFPLSNLLAMAPLDLWLPRLWDARFRVGLKYLPRLLAILSISTVNTILTLPERLILPWVLKAKVRDPIFIVGVHRSGTTHLHNLLSRDPQLCPPRTYHILNPFGVLFSGWLITPLLGAFMTMKRPMDAVRFNIFAPQEDEFAIAGTNRLSPYWGATFPRRIANYDRYIFGDGFSDAEFTTWKRHWLLFLRKLTFWSNKRPVLKSPYHTGRVAMLRRIFPNAKFIHISRHPYAVHRSNMHMAREGWIIFQLQDPVPQDCYRTRFLKNYRALEESYYRDTAGLSSDTVAETRLEDLEQDPVGEVRRLYSQLGIEYSMPFHQRLTRYLGSIADYQKNQLPSVSSDQQNEIDAEMGHLMTQWGYREQKVADAA